MLEGLLVTGREEVALRAAEDGVTVGIRFRRDLRLDLRFRRFRHRDAFRFRFVDVDFRLASDVGLQILGEERDRKILIYV